MRRRCECGSRLELEPLQFNAGPGIFEEIIRAAGERSLERGSGLAAVPLQQIPFADIELRLAPIIRRAAGGKRGIRTALAKKNLDDGIGPGVGLQAGRVGAQFRIGRFVAAVLAISDSAPES